jgi:micrococcal nuclease
VSRLLLTALFAAATLVLACGEIDIEVGTLGEGGAKPGQRTARVERVVDGDTVVLSGLGKARLIGVDTPEVYGGVECYGRAASAFAKRTLDGRRVRWRYDVERRDRYDRALVYLWLDDGRFFNAMLVREGDAQPLTIAPNVEFADRFVALARAARRASRGLWSACRDARE